MHPTSHSIRGYAGGITRAYGTVNVNFAVDLITADVEAFTVDENPTIQLMQNRLKGLARTWYDDLTTYSYTW
jgi:hypothetical protein